MSKLFFENNSFEISSIQEMDFKDGNEYLNAVLSIIYQWNSGEERFQIFTSGSTGPPKEFSLKRNLIIESIERTITIVSPLEGTMIYCPISINGVGGLMQIFRALHLGLDLIVQSPSAKPDIQSALQIADKQKKKIGLASFVPLQFDDLLVNHQEEYQKMENVLIGGASLNNDVIKKLKVLQNNNILTYGMTETYSHIAYRIVGESDFFKPLPGIKISLSEENQLIIENKGMGTILTNDLAIIHSKGEFEIFGRADNIINSGGVKISPEIIEQSAKELLKPVPTLICIGIPDKTLGEKAVLIIEGEFLETSKLLDQLKQLAIKPYHYPKEVFFLTKFPILETGKVDRERIKSLFA